MTKRPFALLCVVLLCPSAWAQTLPPAGVLQVPPKPQAARPEPPPAPPRAAPRAPVQQSAPMQTPVQATQARPAPGTPPTNRSALGHASPGKPPPVVAARPNSQPTKPATAQAGTPPAQGKPGVAGAVAAGAVAAGVLPASAAIPAALPVPLPVGTAPPAHDPAKGSVTGQPLPRWAGILYDGVKLRVGPGQKYPVDWIYRRPDQPVRVLREFDTWRLVEDHEGVKGWVHQSNLSGKRSVMVRGPEATLRRSAAEDAAPVAILKPGVVARVRACPANSPWCEVRVGDHRGWLKRDALWGLLPNETVGS